MYNILTIGGIKLDTFISISDASVACELKMPGCQLCIPYGKKTTVDDINVKVAGSAPNVAIGIAKMKKTAAVYSEMGKDIFQQITVDFLKKNKVETKYIKSITGRDSGFAAILNYKGESTQLVGQNGVEYNLPKKLPSINWIHISELGKGYEKLYRDLIAYKKLKPSLCISFNPGTIQIKEQKRDFFRFIKVVDVIFINKAEALSILNSTGEMEIHNIMAALKQLGPKYVVVTDGQNGAYAYDGKQLDFAPMFPGERVEATGAGDSFVSGFLGALMHGKTHREAIAWGSVNAANVVQYIGPTEGLLTHAQIKNQLKEKSSYKTKEL